MYKVVLLPEAEKSYRKLGSSDRSHFLRVAQALESLKENPFQGKPLKHRLKGQFSLRVGVYRIIYTVEKQKITVYILDIGHRRHIYQ
ncbi:MAG: type II toxin-antitoxin system RelE/ParE family toxin [Candidatus Omnitrophica bacterium]|nr:type II toxin-antitoxin system RelE/ParE family toxin [Candidatus Omnitrophota bacterium]